MSQVRMTKRQYERLMGSADRKKAAAPFARAAGDGKPRRKTKAQPEVKLCDSYRVISSVVTVRVPWPVSVNAYYVRTRFGGVAVGKPGMVYRKTIADEWLAQAGRVTFEGRIAVRLVCVFPDERERDLDNIEKCLFDALQHAGAYRRDSQIKLKTSEQSGTQAPGWVDVTLGPKPGVDVQRGFFGNEW